MAKVFWDVVHCPKWYYVQSGVISTGISTQLAFFTTAVVLSPIWHYGRGIMAMALCPNGILTMALWPGTLYEGVLMVLVRSSQENILKCKCR